MRASFRSCSRPSFPRTPVLPRTRPSVSVDYSNRNSYLHNRLFNYRHAEFGRSTACTRREYRIYNDEKTYKRMKPNGDPELEISNTLKAIRQKARLSPRWISHVLLQCGKRSPDVRARSKQAREIFDSFSELAATQGEEVPGIVYSAAIGALVNNLARRPTEAPDVIPQVEAYVAKMKAAKHEITLPTLTSLVRLYGLARKPEKAMDIVKEVGEQGIATDVQWHNTLIEMYYLNAAPEKAQAVHEKLLTLQDAKANTVTYNLMMKLAVQRNDYQEVRKLFEAMKERGIEPDEFSYLEAIRAAGRLGDPEAAQSYFDEMRAAGTKIAIYVWTALVDAYCRSNAIKKAFDIAEEMRQKGTPPDTVIWRIIRDAAQRCGKGDMWAKLKPSWVSNLHAASLERQGKPDKRRFDGRKDRNRPDKATAAGQEVKLEEGEGEEKERSPPRSGFGRDAAPNRREGGGARDRDRGSQSTRHERGGDRAERRTSPRREAGGSRSPPRRDRGGPRDRERNHRRKK